jgi:branched-subunit amino acid ABC-type transport system permease component
MAQHLREEFEMTDKNVLGPLPRAVSGSLWALLAVLVVMCAIVLRPFLTPLLWAAIVAYTSWPLYRHVRRLCRGRSSVAALLMTALVSLVLVAPLIWLAMLLTDEVCRDVGAPVVCSRHTVVRRCDSAGL